MALTEKLSVALGRQEVRLARRAAEEEGLSLSAFVTTAIRARVAERQREAAAHAVLAAFAEEDLPTPEQEAALLTLWRAPRAQPPRRTKRSRRSR